MTQCQRENSELTTESKLTREEIISLKLRIHALESKHGIKHKHSSPGEKYDKFQVFINKRKFLFGVIDENIEFFASFFGG